MNTRHESDDRDRLERIGATVRQRALSGGEASIVGFTLVIYIFLGAGLGYWLDKNLETSYWIAIGTLAGAGVGFREMFRLINKISADEKRENAKRAREENMRAESSRKSLEIAKRKEEPSEEKLQPRIFRVPPPPQASFDQKPQSTSDPKSTLEDENGLKQKKNSQDKTA